MFRWITIAFFLSGCCHTCFRGRPLSLQCTDLESQISCAVSTPSFCSGIWTDDRWWAIFRDPQLDYLISLSLACHPDMKIAEARICLAKQKALEARAALYPHLFLVGDVMRQKASDFGSVYGVLGIDWFTETSLMLQAEYELDLWKKNRSLFCAEVNRYRAAAAEAAEARLLLSTSVAFVYFNLQSHLERLSIAQRRLGERQEIYALYKQQFDQSMIAEFPLFETNAEVMAIQDMIYQLEGWIAIDRHALAALVGNAACNPESICATPAASLHLPLPLPETLSLDLLARRPDVVAQRWRVEASCYEIKAAEARFLPNINLLATLGFQSIIIQKLFTYDSLTMIGEATGTLPIFTGGKLRAQLGIARETLEVGIQAYNQTVLRAVEQVSNALTDLIAADEREKAAARSIEDAENLYQLALARFQQGVDARFPVLDAEENLLLQEDLFVQIELARLQASLAVIQAIGGGYYDSS